jgi:transposase-like protein
VYRAVDQYGQVIDVHVSKRRNIAAATRFFETMLAGRGRPREVTADLAAPLLRVVEASFRKCSMTRRGMRTTASSGTTDD